MKYSSSITRIKIITGLILFLACQAKKSIKQNLLITGVNLVTQLQLVELATGLNDNNDSIFIFHFDHYNIFKIPKLNQKRYLRLDTAGKILSERITYETTYKYFIESLYKNEGWMLDSLSDKKGKKLSKKLFLESTGIRTFNLRTDFEKFYQIVDSIQTNKTEWQYKYTKRVGLDDSFCDTLLLDFSDDILKFPYFISEDSTMNKNSLKLKSIFRIYNPKYLKEYSKYIPTHTIAIQMKEIDVTEHRDVLDIANKVQMFF